MKPSTRGPALSINSMSLFMNHRLCLVASLLALGASTGHAQIISNFDSGLAGWTGAGGSVTHVASGGNGGGFLSQTDTLNTWMSVSAPAAFLGNLSAYLGGVLSFDGKNLSNSASNLQSGPWFGNVVITGSAGTATRDVAGTGVGLPLANGQWQSFSAALTPALWTGNLAAALANTMAITLTLEFNNAIVETAGLDNFQLSPVPEPASAALLAAGALLVLRRAQRASDLRSGH
jgi:hypothetical protein